MRRSTVTLLLMLCAACGNGGDGDDEPPRSPETLVNLGVASLEEAENKAAEEAFRAALAKRPEFAEARIDLAITLVDLKRLEEAREELERLGDAATRWPQVPYLLGLIALEQQRFDDAVAALESARDRAEPDADLLFYLARAHQGAKHVEEAEALYRETLEIDARHGRTVYKLGQMLARSRDTARREEGAALLRRYAEMEAAAGEKGYRNAYIERGRLAWAIEILSEPPADALPPLEELRYAPASEALVAAARPPVAGVRYGPATVPGDLDNDGDVDLVAGGLEGLRVFLANGEGGFEEQAAAMGLGDLRDIRRIVLVDQDHDADLDLFLIDGAGRPRLFRSTGGLDDEIPRLEETTESSGLGRAGAGIVDAVFTDLDNDRVVDAVLLASDRIRVLHGTRDLVLAAPVDLDLEGAIGLAVGDLDGDSWMDVVVHGSRRVGWIRNDRGRLGKPSWLARGERPLPPGIALLDVDNDSFPDLVAGGRLLANEGRGRLTPRSGPFADASWPEDATTVLPADLDRDGDLDLVIARREGDPLVLECKGGAEKRSWLRLRCRGRGDAGRSNLSGYGAKITVHAGALYRKVEHHGTARVHEPDGPFVHLGLGEREDVDLVKVLWPGGIKQAERDVTLGETREVEELNKRGGSCPFVFVWDGEQFAFVTDVTTKSPLGLQIAPGVFFPPDPHDQLLLDRGLWKPRDGAYEAIYTSQLPETIYLDRASLVAVDHDPAVEVIPHEGLAVPPRKPGRLLAFAELRAPHAARDGEGRDVLDLLRDRDGRRPMARLIRIVGMAEEQALELDLGDVAGWSDVWLVLDGTTVWGNSTPSLAAQQAGLMPRPPTLQVPDGEGGWTDAGLLAWPAGFYKTATTEITDRLRRGDPRVRIVTNLRCFLDRVRVGRLAPDARIEVRDAPLASAEMFFGGYAHLTIEGGLFERWDWSRRSMDEVDLGTPRGRYTRHGDVLPLLGAADDRLAILRHGDAIRLRFDPSALPAPAEGLVRHLVFRTVGWAKDLDPSTWASDRVAPLPHLGMTGYPFPDGEREAWSRSRVEDLETYHSRVER